ncbi:hypothetical protein HKX48_008451 [Thoreauomyces humboldtii]|nr:hypothetical protein HKX48_008451 [Thoreauomyces humboldtii]
MRGRWLWHRKRRFHAIERRWEYVDGELTAIEDVEGSSEGLEPADPNETRSSVAVERQGAWRQKLFTSLRFAGRFVNPFLEWRDKNATNVWEYLRWQLTRTNRNGVPKDRAILEENLPVVQPNWKLLNEFHDKQRSVSDDLNASWVTVPSESAKSKPAMTVTWFGQSTCLVQMDGYNILTDPIFR